MKSVAREFRMVLAVVMLVMMMLTTAEASYIVDLAYYFADSGTQPSSQSPTPDSESWYSRSPTVTASGGVTYHAPEPGNTGTYWYLAGGESGRTGKLEFDVDNSPLNAARKKHGWVEYDAMIGPGGPGTASLYGLCEVGVDAPGATSEPLYVEWLTGDWWRFRLGFQITPNPDHEKFTFAFKADAGHSVRLDNVKIHTECVPECMSLTLIAAGGLAVLVGRRRLRV